MKKHRFAWFIARRLSKRKEVKGRPITALLRFTIMGIALSLTVMLLTIFVGSGFREEVRANVTLLTGDFILSHHPINDEETSAVFHISDSLMAAMKKVEGVQAVRGVLQTAGILKTKESYEGVIVSAINSGAQFDKVEDFLLDGTIPSFDGTDSLYNPILLSQTTARKLDLSVGDKVALYLTDGAITMRSFTLAGIVDMPQVSGPIVIVPLDVITKALRRKQGEVSRVELFFDFREDKEVVKDRLLTLLEQYPQFTEQSIGWNYAEETLPQIFVWLDMLDSNIVLLLGLLSLVASFTLITGLLILILDRTQMIGILKALGAEQATFRSLFLYLATFIVGRGMLWGNLIALLLAFVQKKWAFLTLDPASYYISSVPIAWDWRAFIGVNVGTFILSMLFLLFPIRIIARIRPIETLRFNQ